MNVLYVETPIGVLTLVEKCNKLFKVHFGKVSCYDYVINQSELLLNAESQLQEYFIGIRKSFDLPYLLECTEFQKKVYGALLNIPYAKTASYKDIAVNIASPKAARAVGSANNKNPIPVFIPCHRVVGSSGDLVGYAGGLDIKKFLLKLELPT